MATTRNERPAAIGIGSPVRRFVTVVTIDGARPASRRARSSLTVKVIQSSDPGPDGLTSITPVAARWQRTSVEPCLTVTIAPDVFAQPCGSVQ